MDCDRALRTRGLSLVGPTGLASSQGYGIPGYTAEAYVLIENLGNAVETTTSIDWTNPSWGGTPVLFDGSSNVYSITLQPGEKRELQIHLDVPSSTSLGSVTSTRLQHASEVAMIPYVVHLTPILLL